MSSAVLSLALAACAWAQQQAATANSAPVSVFSLSRDLTESERRTLREVMKQFGASRVESPVFEERGLLLVKSADAASAAGVSAALASSETAKAGLKILPVERDGESLVIRSGRFLVYARKDRSAEEAERSLEQRKFQVIAKPSRYLPAFSVQRSKDPAHFSADRAELEKMPWVRFVVPDSLMVRIP